MEQLIQQAAEAAQARAWYPLIALTVAILIQTVKALGLNLPAKFPQRLQWIPAAVGNVAVALVDAYATGATWQMAVGLVVYAALVGTPMSVGTHHLGKRVTPTARKTIVLLALMFSTPMATTSCAGSILANNPPLNAAINEALAWVGLVDSVATAISKDPNVPPGWADAYQKLRVKFGKVAVIASNLLAEGEESNQHVLAALDELQQIGTEIVQLIQQAASQTRSLEPVDIPEPRFK